ncbi:MAG: antirestriction protein ArdA [Pseudomonadaceae bacterium]|nr:antirestriction protein ArdA [Pseudomonadaceae bacterium]
MTTLFAQPYDISANGFYFESSDEYQSKADKLLNDYGQPVEEFEIQFIDGEDIDCELAKALGLHQGSFAAFLELVETLDEQEKISLIIAVGECGYSYEPGKTCAQDFDIDLYVMSSMRELAEHFVDEGLMGDIPDTMLNYFNYDALARDLSCDYSEITVAGSHYVYACR